MKKKTKTLAELTGWILFIICAVLFTEAGRRNHDPLTLIASLVFLAACLFFIIPLILELIKN